ncbi:hypothetical protein FCM35_KLT17448 [Carex littledalei]|uniref:Uncharacterized protein n=1 Tax=Carex littledalei TaxID=544730 RepID=A0A833RGB6_9POAL|nr:hypothetical protein FCM35_KLT17448 [Carex littledalei]
MRWQSKPSSSHHLFDSKPLLRTSSSPQQPPSHHHHHHHSLLLDPNLSTIAASQSRQSLNLARHSSIPSFNFL